MNRSKVIAACRRAWGDGDLQTVNGGYQWYARRTESAEWLGYTLMEAYETASTAQTSPPETDSNTLA